MQLVSTPGRIVATTSGDNVDVLVDIVVVFAVGEVVEVVDKVVDFIIDVVGTFDSEEVVGEVNAEEVAILIVAVFDE